MNLQFSTLDMVSLVGVSYHAGCASSRDVFLMQNEPKRGYSHPSRGSNVRRFRSSSWMRRRSHKPTVVPREACEQPTPPVPPGLRPRAPTEKLQNLFSEMKNKEAWQAGFGSAFRLILELENAKPRGREKRLIFLYFEAFSDPRRQDECDAISG